MDADLELLIGQWIVKVRPPGRSEPWTWEYEFSRDGSVTWQDLKSAERGSGNWAATSKLVNMWWEDSTTRESWIRPLTATPGLDKTWYESSYYRGQYKIEKPVCPGFLTEGSFKLDAPPDDDDLFQTVLRCWAAGSAIWLRVTKRGNATIDDLVKKYKERGKLIAGDALPEENIIEVFDDIGISVRNMPAVDFTYCFLLEKLKTKGHVVLMSGVPGSDLGHTRVVWGVGNPSNEFFNAFNPLKGQGFEEKKFSDFSGNVYVGWAK
jgi:hypothetical protein